MDEKLKIDKLRNKIYELNYHSALFNFALIQEGNLWKIIESRIVLKEEEPKENEVLLENENFALVNFYLSIKEFEEFLNYLETVYVGNIVTSGSTFTIKEELFYKFGKYKICFVGNFPSQDLAYYGRDKAHDYHGVDRPIYFIEYSFHQSVTYHNYPNIDLSSFEIPFRDTTEAINHFWGSNYSSNPSRGLRFYFPINYVSISSCEVTGKRVSFNFEYHRENVSNSIELSVIANGEELDFRDKFKISNKKQLAIDLGFVPKNITSYLNLGNKKLDENNYYAPRKDVELEYWEGVKKTTINQKKKIIIFQGAGASVQFGIPATKEFKEYLLSDPAYQVEVTKSLLSQTEFTDIEDVLQCIKNLKEARNNHAGIYLNNTNIVSGQPPVSVHEIFGQIDGTYNYIMQKLFEKYQIKIEYKNQLSEFYEKLFKLVLKFNSRIEIGTTNYDLAIETFCHMKPSEYTCSDGFRKTSSGYSWDVENFEDIAKKSSEIPVVLYKIHGSLNWIYGGKNYTKTEKLEYEPLKDSSKNVIVAPTISPKDAHSNEPFSIILKKFTEELEKSKICIVIGFSFRDHLISKCFRDFLEKGKHLIIISPSCFQNYSRGLYEKKELSNSECIDWAKDNQHNTNGITTFIDLAVNRENSDKVFDRLEKAFS